MANKCICIYANVFHGNRCSMIKFADSEQKINLWKKN